MTKVHFFWADYYVIILLVIIMDCIFCKIVKREIPSKVVYEDELVEVIMDVNPIVDGHILVIPKKHYTDFMELDSIIVNHIFEVAKKMTSLIIEKLDANSVTLLVNYGDDQKVKHFHLHLLPDFGVTKSRATRDLNNMYEILTK